MSKMERTDYNGREQRVIKAIRDEGKQFSKEAATEMVGAKQQLQLAVLGETAGGLLGADALGPASEQAGARYEAALAALEAELGIEEAT